MLVPTDHNNLIEGILKHLDLDYDCVGWSTIRRIDKMITDRYLELIKLGWTGKNTTEKTEKKG